MGVKERIEEMREIMLSHLDNHITKAEEALKDHRFADCLEEFSLATIDIILYMEAEGIPELDERNCFPVIRRYLSFKFFLCDLLAGRKKLDDDDADKSIIHSRKPAEDVSNLGKGIRVVGETEFQKMRLRRIDKEE